MCLCANVRVYTLCTPVLTYMHISSYSADTSGSVPLQDSNPICSLYVQLKHRSGMPYSVPIIFLQMFPATFLQCTLLSHSSHFWVWVTGIWNTWFVCRAFHNAPDPSSQGHWGSLCASINCIYGGTLQRASLKRVTGAWAPAIINLVQSRAEPPLCSTNGALIAGTTSWVGRRGVCVVGVGGLRADGVYKALLTCFQAPRPMSPN